MKYSIGLSYSLNDLSAARALADELLGASLSVVSTRRSLQRGELLRRQDALGKTDVFLVLIGTEGLDDSQKQEVETLRIADSSIRVIPVLLPGSTEANLPRSLRGFQAVALASGRPASDRVRSLLAAIRSAEKGLAQGATAGAAGEMVKEAPQRPETQRITLVVERPKLPRKPSGTSIDPAGPISLAQFATENAAHAEDLEAAEEYVRRRGLKVVAAAPVQRHLIVEGEVQDIERAFAPPPGQPEGTPPAELEGRVKAILGLHPLETDSLPVPAPVTPSVSTPRFTCPEIAKLYSFPETDGGGETIAVVCLGGGFHQSDLDAFAASIGLPSPTVESVGVEGGENRPASREELEQLVRFLETEKGPPPSDAAVFTLETTMDIELALGFAPGARVVAYFAPSNDELGFYQAVSAAVFDEQRRPSVISMSWGWKEYQWQDESAAILPVVEDLLAEAGRMGITFCCSSGDSGPGGSGDQVWVQYPASSPHALACGGTMIEVEDGEVVSETAWRQRVGIQVYSSGGGVSTLFERPAWQEGIELLEQSGRRGVPDVSGFADRSSGIAVTVGGKVVSAGGTSAVAPFWSGLIARLNQALGAPIGHANPRLYSAIRRDPNCFRDITAGGNKTYQASIGWDAVTGLGSPHGVRLVAALRTEADKHSGRATTGAKQLAQEVEPSEEVDAFSKAAAKRVPRFWLAAANRRAMDWRVKLSTGDPFYWEKIEGTRAKANLIETRPKDIALLYETKGDGGGNQALVGYAEIEKVLLETETLRLRPRIQLARRLTREVLESAVPGLGYFKHRGALTHVTPEQWAVIREILLYREPELDSELPPRTVRERVGGKLVAIKLPTERLLPGARILVESFLRNTGNVTWRHGEKFRYKGQAFHEDGASPALAEYAGSFEPLDSDVPPGEQWQARADVPELPYESGNYLVSWTVLADEDRWGPDRQLTQFDHSVEVVDAPASAQASEAAHVAGEPMLAPQAATEREIESQADSGQLAAAGEPSGVALPEEPAIEAGTAEPPTVGGSNLAERDVESEHFTSDQLAMAAQVGPPTEPASEAPATIIQREIQVIRERYNLPPGPRKLMLRISGDSATLHFGQREYASPQRIDAAKLLSLEAEPIEYGRALFEMVVHDERVPNSPLESTKFGYRKALEATNGELRFELMINSPSPELRGLAWERLDDGSERPPIATSERTPFYRRVDNRDSELAEPPLEVVVAISSPRALTEGGNALLEGLQPIAVAQEAEVLRSALRPLEEAGLVDYEILGADPGAPLRFEELSDALQGKGQVLHLLAHGLYDREKNYCVAMEREGGGQPLVGAEELAETLLATQKGLRLVVLEACRSGQVARDSATGAALGTLLVAAGLPAVISMRENLGFKVASYFNRRFYFHLARSEHVEMALAATRFNIYQRKIDGECSWSVPVLHLGVKSGQLFGVDYQRVAGLEDVEPELGADGPSRAAAGERLEGGNGALAAVVGAPPDDTRAQVGTEARPLARPQNRSEMNRRMDRAVRLESDPLAAHVHRTTGLDLERSVYHQAASALNAGKHVVFIGAPGTGKTSLGQAIADFAVENGFSPGTIATTASADWTTFDTVGGYVPVSAQRLDFRPGIFMRAIATGSWLVLDEINRAEIDKAVGELFTVLSGQQVDLPYRIQGQPVRLLPARRNPHPHDWVPDEARGEYDYVVHPNWRILATMNVYDKSSLFGMSFAFMRRFAFVDVGVPDEREIFAKLREEWIDAWGERFAAAAPGGDPEELRAAFSRLKELLAEVFATGEGTLMRRRELGPAIAQDMIRYLFDRLTHARGADLTDLAREAFLLYAVPQLDGLDRQAVLDVYGHVAEVFYPEALAPPEPPANPGRPRVILDRLAALYPHVQPSDWARALRERAKRGGR